MKKLLLSSVIMLGVCSFANAQNDMKNAKARQAAPVNSISAAPQASAIPVVAEVVTSDMDAAKATTVNATGEKVVDAEYAKKMEMKKNAAKTKTAVEASKADANKKTRDN